jgi:hypothetical protein
MTVIKIKNWLKLEWSAALTVSSICLSIISMLASAKKKCKPKNDAEFCKRAIGKGPKNFKWFLFFIEGLMMMTKHDYYFCFLLN